MQQTESTKGLRVGLIGYGAIGRQVADALDFNLRGVLVREPRTEPTRVPLLTDIGTLLDRRPHVVIEAASETAVAMYAEPILRSGATLILASTAALLDSALRSRLEMVCRETNARVVLAAGALAGVDALAAASVGGLDHVGLRVVEPGGHARVLFRGSAAEAARRFPGRLNVAATVLLASQHDASVTLEQQPGGDEIRMLELSARGAFGEFITVVRPLPQPRRLSHIVALSLLGALRRMQQPIQVG